MDQWSFLSNTLAQVIGGLLLTALAACAPLFRNRWLRRREGIDNWTLTQSIEGRRLQQALATAVDMDSRALEAKLDKVIQAKEGLRPILVGGLYLDLMVRPVGTTELKAEEWSDADPIEMQLGGSCYWLGKNLHRLHGQSSHLYSMLGGSDDALTASSDRLIAEEEWILNAPVRGSNSSRTAISVHLIQRSNRYSTIFTYRGVLAEMSWRNLRGELAKALGSPSLLHISGFFKTNLSSGLMDFLRPIHNKHVICLDHGGFVSRVESPPAVLAIREVFEQSVVDIYFCTFGEFRGFCEFSIGARQQRHKESPEITIRRLATSQRLPCLTVVRGEDLPDHEKVYIIVKGKVTVVALAKSYAIARGLVFSKMLFDACFLFSLTHNHTGEPLEIRATAAAHEGLISWADASARKNN